MFFSEISAILTLLTCSGLPHLSRALQGLSNPQRGSQCKFGLRYPHTLCQSDSRNLIALEPISINDALERHNFYRRQVAPLAESMPMLQWDNDLATEAERWAATCPTGDDLSANRPLPARPGKDAWDWVNMNLYFHNDTNVTVTDAVDVWGSYKSSWYYGIRNPANPVGLYTQLISARTLYVGCAKSMCENSKWKYTVACYYGPGGNWDSNGNYFAYPYASAMVTSGEIPRSRQWTVPTARTMPPPSINGMSKAFRGPQCRYGYKYPHELCLPDSQNLLSLEKLSISAVLDRHNFYRQQVAPLAKSMPMLQWDDDLATEAERWAATCPSSDDDTAVNRRLPERVGRDAWGWVNQNIYWYKGVNITIANAVDAWAAEKANWYYGIKSPSQMVGHYTQVISARTLYVGCGKSRCQNSTWEYTIVCQYGPGGNWDIYGNYFAHPYVPVEQATTDGVTATQPNVTSPTSTTNTKPTSKTSLMTTRTETTAKPTTPITTTTTRVITTGSTTMSTNKPTTTTLLMTARTDPVTTRTETTAKPTTPITTTTTRVITTGSTTMSTKPTTTSISPTTSTTTTRPTTRTSTTSTVKTTTPQLAPSGNGVTHPRLGPQCKYGLTYPHVMCMPDSPSLISMEPSSISEILDRHNYYRDRVNPSAKKMPRLLWDNDLAIAAERGAAQCLFEHTDSDARVMPPRGNQKGWDWVGQNICWMGSAPGGHANESWTECIDDWASEMKDWQYGFGKVTGNPVGHYTQMVWADTLFVGCGKSRCRGDDGRSEENNLFCNYGPGGNMAQYGGDAYSKPYERA